MSGMYGTVRAAEINIDKDVEIFYHYKSTYGSDDYDFTQFVKLDNPERYLSPNKIKENGNDVNISGLFSLSLPLNKFGKKGIYSVYIRPKEIDATISEIATLAAYPSVRGVVFSLDRNPSMANLIKENTLSGYRIEYISDNGIDKTGDFTLITSSNRAEAISYPLSNTSEKSIAYRFTGRGGCIFCTVTPSISSSFKPNSLPYIGKSGQKVKVINTKFNPVLVEIEMVEHDADTLTYMMEGNQIRNLDKGLITTYNDNNEIYHQSEYFTLKDKYGKPLYDVKSKKENVDMGENFENIVEE